MPDEYKEWIEKNIPITNDWEEEINYMAYLREAIHKDLHGKGSKQLHELDTKWQQQVASTSDGSFKFEIDRSDIPKTQWWWWIDRLDELSPEERSTL